jgi:histidyl-tRNA synthetase
VAVSYLGKAAKLEALKLVQTLHQKNIGALLTPGDRSLKAQLKSANRLDAAFTLILGEDEVKAGQVTVRDMANSSQTTIQLGALVSWLEERL